MEVESLVECGPMDRYGTSQQYYCTTSERAGLLLKVRRHAETASTRRGFTSRPCVLVMVIDVSLLLLLCVVYVLPSSPRANHHESQMNHEKSCRLTVSNPHHRANPPPEITEAPQPRAQPIPARYCVFDPSARWAIVL